MQTRTDDSIRSDVLFELKWDPKISSSSDIAVATNKPDKYAVRET